MKLYLIASLSNNHVIGSQGQLPWRLPKDMAYFKTKTMGHILLMGRRTYESIPPKFRPLRGRYSIVLSRKKDFQPQDLPPTQGCVAHSLEEALKAAQKALHTEAWKEKNVFVIGGAEVYKQAISYVTRLYLTEVTTFLKGDAYFPSYDTEWHCETRFGRQEPDEKHKYGFAFAVYKRKKAKNLNIFGSPPEAEQKSKPKVLKIPFR